jgi:hypothetical protein
MNTVNFDMNALVGHVEMPKVVDEQRSTDVGMDLLMPTTTTGCGQCARNS